MSKLHKARLRLTLDLPWLASLVLRLDLKPSDTPPRGTHITAEHWTACTDGASIWFNPAYVESLTQEEADGLLAHEAMHPALLHHLRREWRDMVRCNIAADCVVNPILVEAGLILPLTPQLPKVNGQPARGLMPEHYKLPPTGTMEEYYALLPDSIKDPQAAGGVMDGNDATEQEWKDALAAAVTIARQAGTLPLGLGRLADDVMTPRVPWRTILARMIERAVGRQDYSYAKPSRRGRALGLVLPGMYGEQIPLLGVVLDTSGSIDAPMLSKALSTVRELAESLRIERLFVLTADAEVCSTTELRSGDAFRVVVKGGGGTDFRPALKALATQGVTMALYVTDLEGTFPAANECAMSVLWLSSVPGTSAPIGTTLHLPFLSH